MLCMWMQLEQPSFASAAHSSKKLGELAGVYELFYVCWVFSEHFGGLLKQQNMAVACIGAALVCSYIYVINHFLALLQLLWIVASN